MTVLRKNEDGSFPATVEIVRQVCSYTMFSGSDISLPGLS